MYKMRNARLLSKAIEPDNFAKRNTFNLKRKRERQNVKIIGFC